jgi:hypothetical protein
VTITCLEIARLKGFKEIRLLSVDNTHKASDQPQYFSPDISNKGINQPNPLICGLKLEENIEKRK